MGAVTVNSGGTAAPTSLGSVAGAGSSLVPTSNRTGAPVSALRAKHQAPTPPAPGFGTHPKAHTVLVFVAALLLGAFLASW